MALHPISLILGISFMATIACRSGHKISGGIEAAGSAAAASQDNADSTPPARVLGEPVAEVPDVPEDEESQVAMEPVSIGGAFLTCRYQANQPQGQGSYNMDCAVEPATDVKVPVLTAAFALLNAAGNRTPLTILQQDLLGLRWRLSVPAASLLATRVQLTLGFLGGSLVNLNATLANPLTLAQVPAFFLGGEPNNLNQDEDCLEFVNLPAKTFHENSTGVTSGNLGRLNDVNCNTALNYLCRNLSSGNGAKWVVSTGTGTFAQSAQACPAGYIFGAPVSTADSQEVANLIDTVTSIFKVLVNMNDKDKEGTYVVPLK